MTELDPNDLPPAEGSRIRLRFVEPWEATVITLGLLLGVLSIGVWAVANYLVFGVFG